jgi:hypothetical protein
LSERRLGRGNRNAERRVRHEVEIHVMAEGDRRRVAAMLAANADLEIGPRFAPDVERPRSTTSAAQGKLSRLQRSILARGRGAFLWRSGLRFLRRIEAHRNVLGYRMGDLALTHDDKVGAETL